MKYSVAKKTGKRGIALSAASRAALPVKEYWAVEDASGEALYDGFNSEADAAEVAAIMNREDLSGLEKSEMVQHGRILSAKERNEMLHND